MNFEVKKFIKKRNFVLRKKRKKGRKVCLNGFNLGTFLFLN